MHTHTQPGSSLSFNSAVSLSFCVSLSLRSWEREKCPGWLRAGELMPHTFCFFLCGQSLNTNICKCGNEDLDLKSCALKMINSLKKTKQNWHFPHFVDIPTLTDALVTFSNTHRFSSFMEGREFHLVQAYWAKDSNTTRVRMSLSAVSQLSVCFLTRSQGASTPTSQVASA